MSAAQGRIDDLCFRSEWRRLLRRYRTRRTQVYGVGSAKSGTALHRRDVFPKRPRGTEPEIFDLIDKIADWRHDRISGTQFTDWIRRRDRRMAYLEVDSVFEL
jgi:hypothetical protein